MNRYTIEVLYDENHELAHVYVDGPGHYGGSWDPEEFGRDLENMLKRVALDIEHEELAP